MSDDQDPPGAMLPPRAQRAWVEPPQASVRVLTDAHDSTWAGTPIAVTLDLMEDGTVRWRKLEGAMLTVADEPGERNIAAVFKGAT
jgi:hypothetical protein